MRAASALQKVPDGERRIWLPASAPKSILKSRAINNSNPKMSSDLSAGTSRAHPNIDGPCSISLSRHTAGEEKTPQFS
jgi:hypothetical protein